MESMKGNKRVSGNHQKGIERVKQRPGDMEKGQGGKMSDKGSANWRRPAECATTPRKA